MGEAAGRLAGNRFEWGCRPTEASAGARPQDRDFAAWATVVAGCAVVAVWAAGEGRVVQVQYLLGGPV